MPTSTADGSSENPSWAALSTNTRAPPDISKNRRSRHGSYFRAAQDYRQARGLCRQALALNADDGSRHLEGNIWNSLGYTEYHADDLGEAAACYERALSIFRTAGDRWGEADTLTNLGDIRHAVGEPLQAREAWQQALTILDDLQHPDAAKVRAKLARMNL